MVYVHRISIGFFVSMLFVACVTGQAWSLQGNNGANGVAGDPGTNGGAGGDGALVQYHRFGEEPNLGRITVGENGGNGGMGGDGLDGNDPDSSANGGNGGRAGNGGTAVGSWFARQNPGQEPAEFRDWVHVITRGGNGGNGGLPGAGAGGGMNGIGGSGGNGGDSWSYGQGSFLTDVVATGGNGGTGYGIGNSGGNGGTAGTSAWIINPEIWIARDPSRFSRLRLSSFATSIPRINAFQFGGNGGAGMQGARGGNGGSVSFGNPNSFFYAPTDLNHQLNLLGRGGNGGNSQDGMAGAGGNAFLNHQYLFASGGLLRTPDGGRILDFQLIGGNGGNGIATSAGSVGGGQAGYAFVHLKDEMLIRNGLSLHYKLYGGNGGAALGGNNTANGANGGVAYITPVRVRSEINPAGGLAEQGRMDVNLLVQGGRGGDAEGSGNGGRGASASLLNTIQFQEGINSLFVLTARGGHGGHGTVGGDGGSAAVSLNDAIRNMTFDVFRYHTFELQSVGGQGGYSRTGMARGGDALTVFNQSMNTFPGGARATLRAEAGQTLGGISGNGTSRGTIFVSGDLETRISSSAFAPTVNTDSNLAAIGTNSYAVADITHLSGTGNTSASAVARGGYGTVRSGWATAIAHADGVGTTGETSSVASSFAHADRDASTANNATSRATTIANDGRSVARANSEAWGHFNIASSRAEYFDRAGRATAVAKSKTTVRPHNATVSSEAVVTANSNSSLIVSTKAFSSVSYRQSEIGSEADQSVSTHLIVNPHPDGVSNFVSGNSFISSVFQPGSNPYVGNVLGIGKMHAGKRVGALDGTFTASSKIDLSLTLDERVQVDNQMLLGLFNPQFTGNGFDSIDFSLSYDGATVIDESFTSLGSAMMFFDDHLFNLETLTGTTNFHRLFQFEYNFTSTDITDSFRFDLIFGDALMPAGPGPMAMRNYGSGGNGRVLMSVPEPGSAMLATMLLTLVTGSARRGKSA